MYRILTTTLKNATTQQLVAMMYLNKKGISNDDTHYKLTCRSVNEGVLFSFQILPKQGTGYIYHGTISHKEAKAASFKGNKR